jgi:hypothetical protein
MPYLILRSASKISVSVIGILLLFRQDLIQGDCCHYSKKYFPISSCPTQTFKVVCFRALNHGTYIINFKHILSAARFN